jgi:hypothetical protein
MEHEEIQETLLKSHYYEETIAEESYIAIWFNQEIIISVNDFEICKVDEARIDFTSDEDENTLNFFNDDTGYIGTIFLRDVEQLSLRQRSI